MSQLANIPAEIASYFVQFAFPVLSLRGGSANKVRSSISEGLGDHARSRQKKADNQKRGI